MDPIYIAITLFLVGITLIFLDLFIPSGATLMILGVLSTIGSILFAFRVSSQFGMIMLTLSLAAVPFVLFLAVKIWPRTFVGRRVILRLPEGNVDPAENAEGRVNLVGEVFELDAPLLPSGSIRLRNQVFNLVAASSSIDAKQRVEVVGKRGREYVVKPTDKPATIHGKSGLQNQPEITYDDAASLLDRPVEELGLDSLDEN